MAANKIQVKNVSLSERCEVCHQADCFDAENNYCSRCAGADIQIKEIIVESKLSPPVDAYFALICSSIYAFFAAVPLIEYLLQGYPGDSVIFLLFWLFCLPLLGLIAIINTALFFKRRRYERCSTAMTVATGILGGFSIIALSLQVGITVMIIKYFCF